MSLRTDKMKILFMGTPDIAKSILESLYSNGHEIVAVVTQPDKPKGRGKALAKPPVKEWAEEHGITVYQPTTLKDPEQAEVIKNIDAQLAVVVAYGKILPGEILSAYPLGCINVHASLLPEYRGAAPIQRCIMNGETLTGVCTMYMDEGLDTGDVLVRKEVKIGPEMNCGELTEALAVAGAEAMAQTVEMLTSGTLERIKQDDSKATYAAKVEKAELQLDFKKDAEQLHNLVRGVYPNLTAYTYIENAKGRRQLKIVKTSYKSDGVFGEPGRVVECDCKKNILAIACGRGLLYVEQLTPEGKNRMNASDFIRGRGIGEGDVLA